MINSHSKCILHISNLSYVKDNRTIINNIDLELYKGEFFSIFGKSGCGKSTLLKIIAGFEKPTSGHIYLNGIDITNLPPEKRPLNMIFQSYALFPHLNVEENIHFGLQQEGLAREIIQERTNDVLQRLKMDRYRYQSVTSLSGGEKQRVAIARALVKQPLVLLLDEPFSALDKSLQESTQLEMVDLQESLGMTFLLVTHDQEEAMTVSSRIAFLEKGELLQVGSPRDIYEFPVSIQVAEFVGDGMNIMRGILKSKDQYTACIECIETESDIETLDDHRSIAAGSEVYIGIRPEKISISDKELVGGIQGKINDIAYLGDMSIYHVLLSSGAILKVSTLNVNRTSNLELTWDQNVYIAWEPVNVVLIKSI